MMCIMLFLFPVVLSVAPTARIDPAHAVNITVYHVNPHKSGAIPVNMDTGNAMGDLFFDLIEVVISPLACQPGSKHAGHGCTNPEAVGSDLVVNKLTLEVDDRYSDYAKCNIGINGTDQRGHACKDSTYCCFCEDGRYHEKPCEKTLGREDLAQHFGGHGGHGRGFQCKWFEPTYMCYEAAVVSKLNKTGAGNAYWYSSLSTGYCDAPGSTGDCTWRVVSVDKIISRKCHTEVFGAVVQASHPGCLDACGDQKGNSSSPCWTDCFYKAAMGPESGKPGGAIAGLSLAELTLAWEKPFKPVNEGGCPAVPEQPSWFDTAH